MKFKKQLATILCVTMMASYVTACGASAVDITASTSPIVTLLNTSKMFSTRDMNATYDESQSTLITLNETTATASSDVVRIDGNTVTITDEGTYILSGVLTNGQIIIEAEKTDKIQLVLNGVTISANTTAPIYVKQADKVFITLAEGSENTLSNTGEFVAIDDNNIDGVIFSKDDLTLNGTGKLYLNTEYGHGIVSKNDLVIASGSYIINAAGHGLAGKDSVRIVDGNFNITSGKDGINSKNTDDTSLGFVYIAAGTFNINATTDGIDSAIAAQIDSGDFNITTGGGSVNATTKNSANQRPTSGMKTPPNMNNTDVAGQTPPDRDFDANGQQPPQLPQSQQSETETITNTTIGTDQSATEEESVSAKAIKSTENITINGGSFTIDAVDDAIHSNNQVCVNGGTFAISTGDDAIHADVQTIINDGSIDIAKCYEGIEAQQVEINGGEISITASDDGINAATKQAQQAEIQNNQKNDTTSQEDCYIKITGGTINVDAGGDGIDSNGSIYVSGGETYIVVSQNGPDCAMDYDGTAEITGGIVVGIGASQMAQNFGDTSTQGSILINTTDAKSGEIMLKDSSGNELLSFTPTKEYNSVVISTPDIKKGQEYSVALGGETQTINMTSVIYGESSHAMGGGGSMGKPNGSMGERSDRQNKGTQNNTAQKAQ